jgi:hypothetical protein
MDVAQTGSTFIGNLPNIRLTFFFCKGVITENNYCSTIPWSLCSFFHVISAQNLEPSLHQQLFMLLSYVKLYLKNEGRKIGEVSAICHANMAHEHYEPHFKKEKKCNDT